MAGLKLFLLGSSYLEQDGQTVEMDTRKALALLSYLAVNGGGYNRDTLAVLLWPDYDESGARGAFRRTLSTLNKALGQGVLEISRERIALAAQSGLWVDAWEFRRLLSASQAHPHARYEVCRDCLPVLQEAVSLYCGDFLAGFSLRDSANFDDWQFFQSEALRQELSGALEKLTRGLAAAGDFSAGLHTARRWLALDPLNESAHRLLMQLYEWSGQHGAALRQYRECVRVLGQQLGVQPLDETTQLYQVILEHRLPPALRWESEPAARPPADHPTPAKTAALPLPGYPLVGRSAELETLRQAYRTAGAAGAFFALQGEAGIGKTRLAQEFIEQARRQGAVCLTARCYEGEASLAFGPLIEALRIALSQPQAAERLQHIPAEWLAEAARLLGDNLLSPDSRLLTSAASSGSDTPGAQIRFFEGVSQTLVGLCHTNTDGAPGILFFDDLHWADSATLDLLAYLARRLAGSGVFLLVSWRDEQLPTEHALRRLLAAARRSGYGADLTLARLQMQDIQQLLTAALNDRFAPTEGLAERLYKETEGLPFFIIEYLENLHYHPQSVQPDWQMPQSVRDLLRSRLSSVDETSRQLLTAAAVLGRSFEFEILRLASGRSELETVDGLERLLQLGLIQEQPAQANPGEVVYDFSHEKLRRLVYDETSLARRRLLHQRAAEALAARLRQRRESAAAVAQHYHLAGQSGLAAEYFKQAGEYARALYANREAITHFQNALACGYAQPAELHEAIGDLYTLSGQYQAALTSYETAAALCPPERLGWLEHRLGNVRHQRGDWELAECHFESAVQALSVAQAGDEQARVYADWSRTAYRRSNLDQALALAERALALAETNANQPALAQAHNMLGLLARSRQNYPQAILHLQHSLEITTSLNDPGGRAAALNNLARVYADCQDLPRSIELTKTALELCQQQGDRHRAAALHNNLADLYHATGNSQAAMDHLKQAVALFAEIGLDAGDQKPEIWMLTEW